MSHDQLVKAVEEKIGQISGQELINKIEEVTDHTWGSRFLRHNKYFYNSSRDPTENPKLLDLHQYALKMLQEGSHWVA